MKHTVTEENTLIEILRLISPDSSMSTLRSWIKEGRVTIDGLLAKRASTPLKPGQCVIVGGKKKFAPEGIEILYDDAYLTVINKPEGLLSVSTDTEKERTAFAILKQYYHPKKVFVVHRLDQATSGVMLFALNEKVSEELKKTFEEHNIERCYYGIAEGHPRKKEGVWESYLFEDDNYVVHSTNNPNKGKLAITHYKVEAESKKHSFIKFTLHTGKKIRFASKAVTRGILFPATRSMVRKATC